MDDWLWRDRFVFVGWSGILLFSCVYFVLGGWFIGTNFVTSWYTRVVMYYSKMDLDLFEFGLIFLKPKSSFLNSYRLAFMLCYHPFQIFHVRLSSLSNHNFYLFSQYAWFMRSSMEKEYKNKNKERKGREKTLKFFLSDSWWKIKRKKIKFIRNVLFLNFFLSFSRKINRKILQHFFPYFS